MPAQNLVCLSVDGLQAGLLGPYGNAWVRTPAVNRLAAQSKVFDQAFVCDPSLDAVLEALWPADVFGNRAATLFTDDPAVDAHPITSVFRDKQFYEPLEEYLTAVVVEDTELGVLFGQAAEWISQKRDPFCLWIHSRGMITGGWDAPLDLRYEYADEEDPIPPEFVEPPKLFLPPDYDPDELLGIQQAYAGQVTAFDACLGALIAAIDESPFAKDTLFVLLGTRGFPIGEHLRVGLCDSALYNELTHVPLIVRFPDGSDALTRSQTLVTHSDLAVLLRGEQVLERDHLVFRSEQDRAIRTNAWYLRESGTVPFCGALGAKGDCPVLAAKHELYAKPSDRYEVNDVANRCPEIVSQLAEVLAGPPGATSQPLPEALVAALD